MKTRTHEYYEQISFQGVLMWDKLFNKKHLLINLKIWAVWEYLKT